MAIQAPEYGQLGNQGIADTLKARDVARIAHRLPASVAPLTLLSSRLHNKRTVTNTTFEWPESRPLPTWDAVTTAQSAAGTALTVANPRYFRKHDLVKIDGSSEVVRVTADPSASQTTIATTRGFSGTAGSISAGTYITRIGSAYPEGDIAGTSLITDKSMQENYVQVIRTPIKLGGRAIGSDLYTGDAMREARADKFYDHFLSIERSLLFSEKTLTTATVNDGTTQELSTTRGLVTWIENGGNVLDLSQSVHGGRLTEDLLNRFCQSIARFNRDRGKPTLVMFCSGTVIATINSWAHGAVRIAPESEKWGLDIKEFDSPDCTLLLMRHPLYEGPTWGKIATVHNMDDVRYAFYKNRDTRNKPVTLANGEDAVSEEYMSDIGLEYRHSALKGGMISGVDY